MFFGWLVRGLVVGLLLVAAVGLGMARALYPEENEFSVMRCTISFLGSPDERRNPEGWRWYQLGMSALVVVLGLLVWWRRGRMVGRPRWLAGAATGIFLGGFVLVLAAVWIPVSREILYGETRFSTVHNLVSVAAFFVLVAGVLADGTSLALARAGLLGVLPHVLFAALMGVGVGCLAEWRRRCEEEPGLRVFPGEGWGSLPMWEWIAFLALCVFLAWEVAEKRKSGKAEKRKAEKLKG